MTIILLLVYENRLKNSSWVFIGFITFIALLLRLISLQ